MLVQKVPGDLAISSGTDDERGLSKTISLIYIQFVTYFSVCTDAFQHFSTKLIFATANAEDQASGVRLDGLVDELRLFVEDSKSLLLVLLIDGKEVCFFVEHILV